MSEYWKSTPKYWCKHCSCYVRDTKLERQNHEATAKHQGALKRSLRNLHRDHEREERDKERAQREIARLNGVVAGASSSSSSSSTAGPRGGSLAKTAAPSESQLKTQREQLAALGVAIPSDFRPEMAMAGEWTVTSTQVIDDTDGQQTEGSEAKVEGKATGVTRKRGDAEEEEQQKEEEAAMRGLFKKPRRWGRDSKTMPQDEDADLDALLSGTIPLKHEADLGPKVEKEANPGDLPIKKEEEEVAIKEEPDTEASGLADAVKSSSDNLPTVKTEEDGTADGGVAAVAFKKRKPKGLRSK